MSFLDLDPAGARAHREVQLSFELDDPLESRTIVQCNSCKVGIRIKDADTAGQPAEIPASCPVLVVIRDVHRMKLNGVRPMPSQHV